MTLYDPSQNPRSIRTAVAELRELDRPPSRSRSQPRSEAMDATAAKDARERLWQARARIRTVMDRPKLYPAGRIIHLDGLGGTCRGGEEGGGGGLRAVLADQSCFDSLILSGTMFSVHLPPQYLDHCRALLQRTNEAGSPPVTRPTRTENGHGSNSTYLETDDMDSHDPFGNDELAPPADVDLSQLSFSRSDGGDGGDDGGGGGGGGGGAVTDAAIGRTVLPPRPPPSMKL